jgi:hypothetical protein
MVVNGKNYITEKEIANQHGIPLKWIQNIRYSNKDFPYYKLNGRLYFNEEEVDNWFKDNLIAM